ncbi:MAG: 5-methylcytosine-specific restriction endonuclease system specificity protein McrC [Christensenellaceae bacterium]|nr:5-methylcytosine-specific restriction endonuclease system specificity protein McrC [Christensenellaceae bacterium]
MIRIQNIYHMLAYAFQVLREDGLRALGREDFTHVEDLYAAILSRGIADLARRGLKRSYVVQSDDLRCPRGKIDVPDTLKRQLIRRQRLSCQYDEFCEDTWANQALKATAKWLLRAHNVRSETKADLKRSFQLFEQVSEVDFRRIRWDAIPVPTQSGLERMLLAVCRMAANQRLIAEKNGGVRMTSFVDDQAMSALYERFVRNYLKKHYPQYGISESYVDWALDEGSDTSLLPAMRTDITVEAPDRMLIIDTKYYAHALQNYHDKQTLHSANLYQVLTYLDNAQAGRSIPVSGALLYARTDEETVPDQRYRIRGKQLWVRTLDLDQPFAEIEEQMRYFMSDWERPIA